MLLSPSNGLLIGMLQIKIHQLLYQGFTFSRNTFIKEQLILYFRHSRTFYGSRVCNDGIQIELIVIYLL